MNKRRKVVVALGASALAPLASFAQQQPKIPRIGFLGPSSAVGIATRLEAFRVGLRDFGYVEGKTIFIDYRWAEGNYGRLPGLAAELVGLNVDVIVTHATNGSRAAKQATTTIPIVMAATGDAVGSGLVANLARPGGNMTGSTFFSPEISTKRMELIKEAVPRITRVAYLLNLDNPVNTGPILRAMEIAASALKIELQQYGVRDAGDFSSAFAAMAKKTIDAVVTSEDALIVAHIMRIVELAAKQRILSIGGIDSAEIGGLIGYGANRPESFRRAAYFVDRILKGAKPADLPIEQPTQFEMVINMKIAKALGVKIPQSILVRATRVIE